MSRACVGTTRLRVRFTIGYVRVHTSVHHNAMITRCRRRSFDAYQESARHPLKVRCVVATQCNLPSHYLLTHGDWPALIMMEPVKCRFDAEISAEIWNAKYRFRSDGACGDEDVEATWARCGRRHRRGRACGRGAINERNSKVRPAISVSPAGLIIASAGMGRAVTLFNCFVMGVIPDNLDGIFEHLREAAFTMQQGGGVAWISPPSALLVRPYAASGRAVGSAFLHGCVGCDVPDRDVGGTAPRRHDGMFAGSTTPDIEQFIDAKRDPARLRNFNVSVLVTDAFMAALGRSGLAASVRRPGLSYGAGARSLGASMRATYDVAEPGVIFIDRVNAENNLAYCEQVSATNPCGEQPLPPYGLAFGLDQPIAARAASPLRPTPGSTLKTWSS